VRFPLENKEQYRRVWCRVEAPHDPQTAGGEQRKEEANMSDQSESDNSDPIPTDLTERAKSGPSD
jgi:hypothetical protein